MKKFVTISFVVVVLFLVNLGKTYWKNTKQQTPTTETVNIGLFIPYDEKDKIQVLNEKELNKALESGDYVEIK